MYDIKKTEPRIVRVFISSTFQDFQQERDYLVKYIFPELRSRCRKRQVEFIDVDLRWGITQEQSEQGKTLPICLAEIEHSRPYFIGLLGERYGWLPDVIPEELLVKEKWLNDYKEHSITELEILHGVLNNPKMANHAFFYFRNPNYIDDFSEEVRNKFIDQNEINKEKLIKLKKRILESKFPVRINFPDPMALGNMVLEDLWKTIDDKFPEGSELSFLEKDYLEHEAFLQNRAKVYIRREEYFTKLNCHINSNDKPLIILGDSGCGKTALLSNWINEYREKNPNEILFFHFIGGTQASSDPYHIIRRLMECIRENGLIEGKLPDDPKMLPGLFAEWLNIASEKGRMIIILDGLNQMETKGWDKELFWLPVNLPPSIRLIISSLPSAILDELLERNWQTMTVRGLGIDERKKLIQEYLQQYSKNLDLDIVDFISNVPATENPLYLKGLLDELKVAGTYETLNQTIHDYLKATGLKELFNKKLERLERDYDYERKGLVKDSLILLWIARRGLSESELLELLGKIGKPVVRAVWSPFYLAIEDSLINKGGNYSFYHDTLRQAVEDRYLNCEEDRKRAHKVFAEMAIDWRNEKRLSTLNDYSVENGAYHFREADDPDGLWNLLCDEEYRNTQINFFNNYTISYNAILHGLEFFSKKNSEKPEDDPRLCWLSLRAGKLGEEARMDVRIAFEWVEKRPLNDPFRIKDALKRLTVLDEENFFKAAILLLWIETDRQNAEPDETKINPLYAQEIIDEINKKLPEGNGTVDWYEIFSDEFMAWWIFHVLNVFSCKRLDGLQLILERTQRGGLLAIIKRLSKRENYKLFDFILSLITILKDTDYDKGIALSCLAIAITQTEELDNRRNLLEILLQSTERIQYKDKSLESIISGLAYLGYSEDAIGIIDRNMGFSGSDRYEALSNIAFKVSQSGNLDLALRLINRIPVNERLRKIAFSNIVSGIAQSGNIEASLLLVEKVEDELWKSKAFSSIIIAIAKERDFNRKREFYNFTIEKAKKIDNDYEKSMVLYSISSSLIQIGEKELVMPLIETVLEITEGITNDFEANYFEYGKPKILSGIASIMIQLGEKEKAEYLFGYAIKTMDEIKGHEFKYTFLHSDNKKFKALENIINNMLDVGEIESALKASEKIYDVYSKLLILKNISCKITENKDFKKIENLFESVLKTLKEVEENIFGLVLTTSRKIEDNYVKYEDILSIAFCFAKVGEQEKASALYDFVLKIADRIIVQNDDAKSKALTAIASSLAQAGEKQWAKDVFELTLKSKGEINDFTNTKSLAGIVTEMINSGEVNDAVPVLNLTMKKLEAISYWYWKDKAIINLVTYILRTGDYLKTRDLLDSIIRKEIVDSYNNRTSENIISEISRAIKHNRNFKGKIELFELTLQIISKINDDKRSMLSNIVSAMLQSEYLKEKKELLLSSLDIVRGIKKSDDKAYALYYIVSDIVNAEYFEGQKELIELSFEMTTEIDSWEAAPLKGIAYIMAQADMLNEMKDLLKSALMHEIKGGTNDENYWESVESFAMALRIAKTGNFEEAISIVGGIYNYERWEVFSIIVSMMAKFGDFGSALNLTAKIGNDEYKSKSIIEIITQFIQKENNENPNKLLESALESAQSIKDIEYKPQTLLKIASAFAQVGDQTNARSVFEGVINIIETINFSLHKKWALEYAATELAQSGPFENRTALFIKILKLTEKIGDEHDAFNSVLKIISEIASTEVFNDVNGLLRTTFFSNKTWDTILPEWRYSLIENNQNPIHCIRGSLLYNPFSNNTANNGVYSLISALIKEKNAPGYQAIIRMCPQIDLDFLLKEKN